MEEEKSGSENRERAQAKRSLLLIAFILIVANVAGNTGFFGGGPKLHPFLIGVSALIVVYCIAVGLLGSQLTRFVIWSIGSSGYVQVTSRDMEQRLQTRYQAEIRQFEFIGFDYLFAEGETISLFRFLLLFPALVALTMRAKGDVTAIHNGTHFISVRPIFASADKTAYGHPSGLGVTFHTTFQDGTILITKNYGDPSGYPPKIAVQPVMDGARISDVWTQHQQGIANLQAEGKRVDNPISFEAYADISRKEDAA
jgi:hypothetical protein